MKHKSNIIELGNIRENGLEKVTPELNLKGEIEVSQVYVWGLRIVPGRGANRSKGTESRSNNDVCWDL